MPKLNPRKKASLTFADFFTLVKEKQKGELIDGIIYFAPLECPSTNSLFLWLSVVLDCYVEELDLGQVFGSRVAFRLSDTESPEPDLAVMLKHRLHLVERGFVDGRPDLAIEIVSPESVERDYVKKRRQYQKAGVPEYWIVDEDEKKVTLLRLGADHRYREERSRGGVLRSHILPGFWLRLEWLWQIPRNKKVAILNEIFGRKK